MKENKMNTNETEYKKLERKARKAMKSIDGLPSEQWPMIVHQYLDHPITKQEIKINEEYRYACNN